MELRRLRLLDELSRRGTIAAVAEALAYSPSSVSVQLAELEKEAGVPLLRRAGRNVQLTAAGWRLAEHAGRALDADEAIRGVLQTAHRELPRGHVRVSVVQTPALALLPETLAALAERAPDLRVEVRQRETAPALDELRARALDLVVGIEYDDVPVPRHRDVDRRDLVREDVLLALPAADPLAAAGGPVALGALADAAWAAGYPGTGHGAVVEHLANRLGGYAPDIRHRTDDGLILGALVASGHAVTLLPALLARDLPAGVALRPVAEGTPERTIFTACRTISVPTPPVAAARAALLAAAQRAMADRGGVRVLGA